MESPGRRFDFYMRTTCLQDLFRDVFGGTIASVCVNTFDDHLPNHFLNYHSLPSHVCHDEVFPCCGRLSNVFLFAVAFEHECAHRNINSKIGGEL